MTAHSDDSDPSEEAHTRLEPDALHEGEDGYYVDCPKCGATASLEQIVFEGHCSGAVDEETAEGDGGTVPRDTGCTADLALELVWSP